MPSSGGIVVTAGDVRSMDTKRQRGDSQSCFSPEELAAFVAGRLPKQELDSVAAHIQGCPMCAKLVEAARGGAFTPALGESGAEDRFDEEPEGEELASRALAFRPLDELESLAQGIRLTHLSDFYVGDRIGSGPHGTVYGGWQYHGDRKVALKVLPGGAAISHRRRRRLTNSTTAAAGLAGPCVLPVLDTVRHEASLVLVTPHVEGVSLAILVRDRRRARQGARGPSLHPWARFSERKYLGNALMALDQLVDSVAKLHEAGALYRELKPSNCLVGQRGELWLTDFGLASLWGHGAGSWFGIPDPSGRLKSTARSVSNITLSAPGFTSPEEWLGLKPGRRADVFRLGAILYQTLTLELPYGIAPVTKGRPIPTSPSTRQPALAPDFDGLILKALHVNSEERYASAGELREQWIRVRAGTRGTWLRLARRWFTRLRSRVYAAWCRPAGS
jgi:eukaryotic-like serine/threonine-protein kinase